MTNNTTAPMSFADLYGEENLSFGFEVARNKRGKELYYLVTPRNHSAYDWASKFLTKSVRWGRSYLLRPKKGLELHNELTQRGFIIN